LRHLYAERISRVLSRVAQRESNVYREFLHFFNRKSLINKITEKKEINITLGAIQIS